MVLFTLLFLWWRDFFHSLRKKRKHYYVESVAVLDKSCFDLHKKFYQLNDTNTIHSYMRMYYSHMYSTVRIISSSDSNIDNLYTLWWFLKGKQLIRNIIWKWYYSFIQCDFDKYTIHWKCKIIWNGNDTFFIFSFDLFVQNFSRQQLLLGQT